MNDKRKERCHDKEEEDTPEIIEAGKSDGRDQQGNIRLRLSSPGVRRIGCLPVLAVHGSYSSCVH